MADAILREGENCWCRPRALRAAVLIDAAAYYEALAAAIERAERSIVMIGWDFHSRVRLRRGEAEGAGEEAELLALIEREVRRKRSLRVSILAWDFAMIYALEREWQPLYRFDWSTHRRISFRLDSEHPLGASQHQKIVVVDDALAFSGGLDVTVCRWDTRDHARDDPRRSDPGFDRYGAFHDVQMAVDGDAALAIAELARERWKTATGRSLRPVRSGGDPWPPGLLPQFRDVAVGISRTFPAHAGREEVREVERLYVDSLRAAERWIYLENQYFTSDRIAEVLLEVLAKDPGPEVVVVLPSTLSGWLEERTMGVRAARLMQRLRDVDRFGRLCLLRPELPEGETLCVHAKVAIVDARLLRVGSANTSNRSMGFDSECDLSIESTPERCVAREIRGVRLALLAEHLACTPEDVADAHAREGSLVAAIDRLATGERRLVPVPDPEPGWLDEIVAEHAPFDPERPLTLEELLPQLASWREAAPRQEGHVLPAVRIALGVLAVLGLLATWQLTPLAEALDPTLLAERIEALGATPPGVLLTLGGFAVASSLLVPVTALIAASGLVFGFARGALIGLAGSVLGAGIGYAAGRWLWRDSVRRLAGRRLDGINRHLSTRGVLAAAILRLVPVAPFGVVNLVAGASHLRARDFLLGTAIGMAPGTAALAYFGHRALAALRDPGWETVVVALAVLLVAALAGRLLARRFPGGEGPRVGGVAAAGGHPPESVQGGYRE